MTREDRDRFIVWLDQQRRDDASLADQCDRIGEANMAKKLRLMSAAVDIVLDKLRSTEVFEVTHNEVAP